MISGYAKIIKPDPTRPGNSLVLPTNARGVQRLPAVARNANYRPETNARRGRATDDIESFEDIDEQRPESEDNDTGDEEQVEENGAQAEEDEHESDQGSGYENEEERHADGNGGSSEGKSKSIVSKCCINHINDQNNDLDDDDDLGEPLSSQELTALGNEVQGQATRAVHEEIRGRAGQGISLNKSKLPGVKSKVWPTTSNHYVLIIM